MTKPLERLLDHIDRCPIDWSGEADVVLHKGSTPRAIVRWLRRLDDLQAKVREDDRRREDKAAEAAERVAPCCRKHSRRPG